MKFVNNESALNRALDTKMDDGFTIKEYLYNLLATLWGEKESFSGKRPFGSSGWEYDLYTPLVRDGFINGKIDNEGCVDTVDTNQGYTFVRELIYLVFFGNKGN